MRIGIIDADLIGRRKHRFPNLVCEKISGYWKEKGADVTLILDEIDIDEFDFIYISKVFTDTPVPEWIKAHLGNKEKVSYGGTGFFFDKAPNLDPEIEHHMPDYSLYDNWIDSEVNRAAEERGECFKKKAFMTQFKEYSDYSVGFLTRGCFRKCKFCVNQKYDHVFPSSPLDEFFDRSRRCICLLDDNFLGSPKWRELLQELIDTGYPFKFKQGLDERLLTDEKCEMLFSAKYDGDYTFAFDNIADYELIKRKLQMIRKYTKARNIKFYVLVGFEGTDEKDIENCFKRLELLMHYQCLPYIMRYQDKNYKPWMESCYRGIYVALARWGNQPSIYKKMSFRRFCEENQKLHKTPGTYCSAYAAMLQFEKDHPDIAKKYFDLRYEDFRKMEDKL